MKKTILTYVFSFFFCLLFILGLTSWYFSATAFNEEKYMETMRENGYSEIVLTTVKDKFEDFGDEVALDAEELYALVDEKSLVEHSEKYTKAYLTAILNNKNFSNEDVGKYDFSYAKDGIRNLLLDFYKESENDFSEEELNILFSDIEAELNSTLRFLPKTVLDKTIPYGKYAVKAKSVLDITKLALIPALLLLAGIVLLSLKKGLGKMMYRAGAALFIPSAILFIPFFLFNRYNLGSKVVIMKSQLSVVFSSVVDTLVKKFVLITGVLFAVSLLIVIVGAILTVAKLNSKGDAENVRD